MVEIGAEQVARLTELRRNPKALPDKIKGAKTQKDSRLILTTHGRPVAVLQEYRAYQELLALLEETQRQLEQAEVPARLEKLKEGRLKSVPLADVVANRQQP